VTTMKISVENVFMAVLVCFMQGRSNKLRNEKMTRKGGKLVLYSS
jgi:hypothetical protein